MAGQRREFTGAAATRPRTGQTGLERSRRAERTAENCVPAAFRGGDGDRRDRARDGVERGDGKGAPVACIGPRPWPTGEETMNSAGKSPRITEDLNDQTAENTAGLSGMIEEPVLDRALGDF